MASKSKASTEKFVNTMTAKSAQALHDFLKQAIKGIEKDVLQFNLKDDKWTALAIKKAELDGAKKIYRDIMIALSHGGIKPQ